MIGRFLADRSGHTAIEYGMIALLCSIAIVTSATAMGDSVSQMFDSLLAAWSGPQS